MADRHRVEQRYITHRGRQFHFVSYEGQPANSAREVAATGPAWFLVNAGHRWKVMPYSPDIPDDELDRQFAQWLEAQVFAEARRTPG